MSILLILSKLNNSTAGTTDFSPPQPDQSIMSILLILSKLNNRAARKRA
ncbi:MAG: hypothetical protein GTO03_12505 [Planctomycetales bacterium]|nr:hypothetical protein [Planctomycetales bacterium]